MKTSFHTASADLYTRAIRDARPLKVWVYTAITGWVELGSTNRVRVLSNYF